MIRREITYYYWAECISIWTYNIRDENEQFSWIHNPISNFKYAPGKQDYEHLRSVAMRSKNSLLKYKKRFYFKFESFKVFVLRK